MKKAALFLLLCIPALLPAQTVCDSVDVLSVKYSPFTDTAIVVHVQNNNQNEIFDYPGFVLLDDNGDTVAVETVNYFGIGQESVHTLSVQAGVHDPPDNFTGLLELYSGFYDTFECGWNLDQSLCADEPCDSLIIGLQNFGGALVVGDFAWNVENDASTLVDSGSFTMTDSNQYWFHGLCLEPGSYTYSLMALSQPSGGGPTLTVSSSTTFGSPGMSAPLDWFNNPGAELPFSFFEFCTQGPNSVPAQNQNSKVQVLRNGSEVILNHAETIQTVEIYAIDGKLVHISNPNNPTYRVPKTMVSGVYILIGTTENHIFREKIVLR